MANAHLKCVRCDLSGPSSSFYWVRAEGWCCAQHPEEADPKVLEEWFLWNFRRAPTTPHPRTEREVRARQEAFAIHWGDGE